MGILSNEINFSQIINDFTEMCLGVKKCGECKKEECLIGYSKECLKKCLNNGTSYVTNGCDEMPTNDYKIYDEEKLISGIVDILKQCKSCDEEHYESCLINVIRSSYEMALFQERLEYKGSSYKYINDISKYSSELSDKIIDKIEKEDINKKK